MIYNPPKYHRIVPNINEELLKLSGELDDKQCKLAIGKLLRYNLGHAVELISGVKLPAYQEIALKSCFLRNYNLMVWGRGCAKSFMAALACFFIPIFEPGTNIVIAGPTFRTARNIFSYMEKICRSPEATLLSQCLTGGPVKRPDMFEWHIGESVVRAIPLNGEKIRGLRAQVLILDEFLLLSEDIVKNVLMPFLVSPADIDKKLKITEKEDFLIKRGLIKESERTVFTSNARMICLSSASYTFEYLYQVYQKWTDSILSNEAKNKDGEENDFQIIDNAKYCVSQVSHEALPSFMIDKKVIEEAKQGDEVHPSFKREYCAQFVDGSDSYFSAKKMHELTVKDGERPTVLVKGNPSKKYILSIDPSWGQSPSSDFFAMCVLELNEEKESCLCVHNYGIAGVELRKHIEYFYYLLNAFNIVLIIADNADGNFIQSCNESSLFQSKNLKLNFLDYDGSLEGNEYSEMLKVVRNQYNFGDKKICFKHVFNQTSIRRMNEQLQTYINTNRVHFGSKLVQIDDDYEKAIKGTIPYPFTPEESTTNKMSEFIYDLISDQDKMIYELKKQCSLIEVRVSPTGGQTFDLPLSLRRNNSPTRARKDNYTALLLGVEGVKSYFDIIKQPLKQKTSTFTPILFGNSTYK